jgi:hypothetical protein
MSNATKSEKDVRVKFLIDEIRVFVGEMLRRKHGDGIRNFCKTLSEPVLTTDAEFPLAITEEAAREDDTTVRPFSDVNESLRKQLPSEEQFSTPSENDAVLQDQQNDHAPIITIHGICWVAEYMREMRPLESDLSETLPMFAKSSTVFPRLVPRLRSLQKPTNPMLCVLTVLQFDGPSFSSLFNSTMPLESSDVCSDHRFFLDKFELSSKDIYADEVCLCLFS